MDEVKEKRRNPNLCTDATWTYPCIDSTEYSLWSVFQLTWVSSSLDLCMHAKSLARLCIRAQGEAGAGRSVLIAGALGPEVKVNSQDERAAHDAALNLFPWYSHFCWFDFLFYEVATKEVVFGPRHGLQSIILTSYFL